MKIGFLSYIIPSDKVLIGIIICMFILAIYILLKCIRIKALARTNLNMLDATADVQELERVHKVDGANPQAIFENFENKHGKSKSTDILFEHIRAIYDSGIQSSRLDADLLVKNSIDKIFSGVDFIKTAISLFLIMGILGTLYGLASSIGSFYGLGFDASASKAAGDISLKLNELFKNLRGAFAPSMWGVFLTIIFVFFYTWFIQEGAINKLTEKLTITTIRDWLPHLYPTDFQRSDNSMLKLKNTIKNADGINNGVKDLQKSLSSSNETLKELSKVSNLISSASEKFDKSTDKITKLETVFKQLEEANTKFKDSVSNLLDNVVEENKKVFSQHMKAAIKTYGSLSDVKESIKSQQEQFTVDINKMLDESKQFNGAYEERTNQIVKRFEELRTINDSITQQTQGLTDVLVDRSKDFHENQQKLISAISGHMINELADIPKSLNTMNNMVKESLVDMKEVLKVNSIFIKEEEENLKNMREKFSNSIEDFVKSEKMTNLTKAIEDLKISNDSNVESLAKALEISNKKLQVSVNKSNEAMQNILGVIANKLGVDPRDVSKAVRKGNQSGFMKFTPQSVLAIFIALLLLISVITQMFMVNKISGLQEQQVQITQELQKQTKKSEKKAANANNKAGDTANKDKQDKSNEAPKTTTNDKKQ